jgi:hypothetical protein
MARPARDGRQGEGTGTSLAIGLSLLARLLTGFRLCCSTGSLISFWLCWPFIREAVVERSPHDIPAAPFARRGTFVPSARDA